MFTKLNEYDNIMATLSDCEDVVNERCLMAQEQGWRIEVTMPTGATLCAECIWGEEVRYLIVTDFDRARARQVGRVISRPEFDELVSITAIRSSAQKIEASQGQLLRRLALAEAVVESARHHHYDPGTMIDAIEAYDKGVK